MQQAVVAENGMLIGLAPQGAEIVDHVPAGRLVLDGTRLIAADSPVLRERQRLLYNGLAMVSLVVDREGTLAGGAAHHHTRRARRRGAEVEIRRRGARTRSRTAIDSCCRAARAAATSAWARPPGGRCGGALFRAVGKKPVTQVHLIRL